MAIDSSSRAAVPRAKVWAVQTDSMLCRAGRWGNEHAFEELHRRYHRQLSAFVFHMLGGRHRREDTEDVVQDAFARAFASVRSQDFDGSFKQWLFVIARNRAIDLMRATPTETVELESQEAASTPQARSSDEPVAAAEVRADLEWLVAAITELPERQRSALLLRELGGLSYGSIAETMRTSPGSVRQLIGRGRDGVRRAAADDVGAPGSLRRGLLEAAPILPIGGLGAGAVAVTGAGTGGAIVSAKLAAALASVLLFAGAAGTIGQKQARADEPAKPEPAAGLPGHTVSSSARPERQRPKQSSPRQNRDDFVAERRKPLPKPSGSSPTRTEPTADPAADESQAATPSKDTSEPESPLQPVADLPGEIVEDVGGALNGEKPLGEAVGDTAGTVVSTAGETVNSVSGALAGR